MQRATLECAVLALCLLVAPDPADAQEAAWERVLPAAWPATNWKLTGTWELTLRRAGFDSLQGTFIFRPDSVPKVAETLRLTHTCYRCLKASVDLDWERLGLLRPLRSELRAERSESGAWSLMIGTGIGMLQPGGLVFVGHERDGAVEGTWYQGGAPDQPIGTFVLRRSPI